MKEKTNNLSMLKKSPNVVSAHFEKNKSQHTFCSAKLKQSSPR